MIGGRKTTIQQYPVLPSSLPNRIVTIATRYGKLPSQLQHYMAFAFEKDMLGDLVDPISYPYAQLNNQKVTLSFKPTSIPAYLIAVIPELKLNGQTIK